MIRSPTALLLRAVQASFRKAVVKTSLGGAACVTIAWVRTACVTIAPVGIMSVGITWIGAACIGMAAAQTTSASRPAHKTTILRVADHGGFGRVVFVLPASTGPRVAPQQVRDGDRLILELPGAGTIVTASPGADVTRHVRSAAMAQDRAVLTLDPGSTTRIWRSGNTVVVDVFGPAAPVLATLRPVPEAPAETGGSPATAAMMPLSTPPRGDQTRQKYLTRESMGDPSAAVPKAARPQIDQFSARPEPPGAAKPEPPVTAKPEPHVVRLPPTQTAAAGMAAPLPAASRGADAEQDDDAAIPPPVPDPPVPDPAATDAGGEGTLRAIRLPGPDDEILLPFDAGTGAASFARGAVGPLVLGHVVFDTSKAIDLAALKGDPVFGAAGITLLPASTQLTMPVPAGSWLALRRTRQGWVITMRHGRGPPESAPARLKAGIFSVAMPNALGSVVLVDPVTGGKLLVGTVRDHGAGILVPHTSPEVAILPSWEGVLAAARSDRLALEAGKAGFRLLAATGPPLSAVMGDASQAALESAGPLTKRFDIPPLPVPSLLRLLDADISAASTAPKQARFMPRLRAARDMLGLGMDREAAALMAVARQDEPVAESQPDAVALLGMARWLAGMTSPGVAGPGTAADPGLANAALGGSDEVALWRAMAQPLAMPMAERAAIVAACWRVLQSYPAPLRRMIMPVAAAILIDGNQRKEAAALLDAAGDAGGGDPPLLLARARLLQASGKDADALALLDRVAASDDRKNAAAAWRMAIEQRLAMGQLPPAKAAAQILSQIDRWREPAFEIAQRLRASDLLIQDGDFRGGLSQMREIDRLFPDTHDRVHAAEQRAVRALVKAGAGARLAPVDLVALVDENTDLLGEREVANFLTPLLVEKLMALDLPERAEKLVVKLLDSTADPVPRADLGSRLAGLSLDQRDAAGALAALDATDCDGLAQVIVETRSVQRAGALVLLGKEDDARRILAPLSGVDALTMQAQLSEKARDWHAAEGALQMLAHAQIFPGGTLSDSQQDLVLRLASAASQAGDAALLRVLQRGDARRLSPGPRATLFQMLVTQPVQAVADLPRSGREAEAARSLPAALASYQAH